MYKNLEIINKVAHKDKFVKNIENFLYSKEQTNVPITVAEFYEVCKNYSIFFGKDADNKWFASAILGFKEKQNNFVDEKGNWEKKHYIPAFIRRYPFILIEQDEQLLLSIEKEFLSENKDNNAKKIFDGEKNSEFLDDVLNFLNQFFNEAKLTTIFIEELYKWGLLEEKVATIVTANNEQYNINGLYIVNEEKLKHLSKKRKEEIYNKDMMPLIIAHLISLSNINKLG